MSTGSRFEKFLSNIIPTQSQRDDATTKVYGVCKKLHDAYYSTEYSGSTKLLIGSHGRGTNIRPPRDVDVIFKLPISKFKAKDLNSTYNYQSYLLQQVRDILLEKYSDTTIRSSSPVVEVGFGSNHYIEVLPGFELQDGSFIIPKTDSGGRWQLDYPRELNKYVADSNTSTNLNTTRLIRMIKKWQDHCNVPISTLAIELRAVNFMKTYEYADRPSVFYDWMIRDYFRQLVKYSSATCKLPGSTEVYNYGNTWLSKATSALSRSEEACKCESQKFPTLATNEWKKIFGDDYEYE